MMCMLWGREVTQQNSCSQTAVGDAGTCKCLAVCAHMIVSLLPVCVCLLQNMLLRRLWEVQQQQERERQEQEEAAAAAATAGSSGMDVDGATPATPLQRAGLLQKDLVDWYITKQIERCVRVCVVNFVFLCREEGVEVCVQY